MINFITYLENLNEGRATGFDYDTKTIESILKKIKFGGTLTTFKDLDGTYKVSVQPLRNPSNMRPGRLLKGIVLQGFDDLKSARAAAKSISSKYGKKYSITYATVSESEELSSLVEGKGDKVEKLVSFLKIKGYGDMLIIKVLDGLGNNPQKKQLQAALKKAKVKDQDITGAAAAMNEESE